MASGVSELLWLLKLFEDLVVSFNNPPLLHEDYLSCIHSLSRVEHKKLKHVDVKFHFLKDVYNKRFFFQFVMSPLLINLLTFSQKGYLLKLLISFVSV